MCIDAGTADLNILCTSDTSHRPQTGRKRFKTLHLDQLVRIAAHAVANGGRRVSPTRIEWDIAGNCEASIDREIVGRPDRHRPDFWERRPAESGWRFGDPPLPPGERRAYLWKPGKRHVMVLHITTRCRKCDRCRQTRKVLWTLRTRAEVARSTRTWFGTITLRPEEQFRFLAMARKRLSDQGIDYDALDLGEQFSLVHNEISRELTKFLKRVRKQSAASIRFLCVAEHHKSGLPHYHMLIHEKLWEQPVRHAVLSKAWPHGFTQWKLIDDPKQAEYLCKYLSKSSVARVRASLNYGKT